MSRFHSVLSPRHSVLLFSVLAALGVSACSPKIVVRPVIPRELAPSAARAASVSLYVAPAIASYTHLASAATGDIAFRTIHIEYRIGKALSTTIKHAAQASFRHVVPVDSKTCAAGTDAILTAQLAQPPAIHAHWGGNQGEVGGGTIADLTLDLLIQSCSGKEVWRGSAAGHGDVDQEHDFSDWPDADDFRPGMNATLQDLSHHLTAALATAKLP